MKKISSKPRESGMSDLIVFIVLTVPIIAFMLLALNFVVYTASANAATAVATTAARMTAARVGDNVVPYAPNGQTNVTPSSYLRTSVESFVPFSGTVVGASCGLVDGAGNLITDASQLVEAGSPSRCIVTYNIKQLSMPILDRLFGQATVVGESITTTGTNPNVQ